MASATKRPYRCGVQPRRSDEQLVQLGRAVGPEHVGGLGERDAGAEVAGVAQPAGVVGHAAEAVGVHLVEQRAGPRGRSAAAAADEQQDRARRAARPRR